MFPIMFWKSGRMPKQGESGGFPYIMGNTMFFAGREGN